MDTVIPEDVLEHLRAVNQQHTDLEGFFRTENVSDALGVSINRARGILRRALRQGVIVSEKKSVTEHQARELGLLGAGGVTMYRVVE